MENLTINIGCERECELDIDFNGFVKINNYFSIYESDDLEVKKISTMKGKKISFSRLKQKNKDRIVTEIGEAVGI